MEIWIHSNCLHCQEPDEDATHVIRCYAVTSLWPLAIKPLTMWLTKADTPSHIMAALLERIRAWYTSSTLSCHCIAHCTPGLAATIQAQNSIGWQLFFEGSLATEWELLLDWYFNSTNSKRSGCPWFDSSALAIDSQLVGTPQYYSA